jgi:XTP/dITP diphosphohydrolase
MHTILLGSNNPHKVEELRAILETQGLARIILPSEVRNFPTDIPETGTTLEENAFLKASTIYQTTLQTCISDDTGLEVDALNGAPGVYTARFAGENATYADNRTKLLETMRDAPLEKRTARFRTVICYHDALRVMFVEGVCEGHISEEERGEGGFGYDSIFIPQGYSQTFAELSSQEKNLVSHRAKALQEFQALLRSLV